jgi:hypothetical protein
MPFAGYKDFADCVRRNQKQDNPEAYCGAIQARAEKAERGTGNTAGASTARSAVDRALASGDLKKPKACQRCGATGKKLEAHHPDRSQPLRVKFLCRGCHQKIEPRNTKKAWQWFLDWLDKPKPESTVWKSSTAIVKVDDEKQIVYGPVLEPLNEHEPDAQQDWYTDADIEAAAHRFMLKAQLGKASADGINHDRWVGYEKAHVVESWITHEDTQYGTDTVRKGTWMMGVHVPDKELWESVKAGELTGFSIGGRGIRI